MLESQNGNFRRGGSLDETQQIPPGYVMHSRALAPLEEFTNTFADLRNYCKFGIGPGGPCRASASRRNNRDFRGRLYPHAHRYTTSSSRPSPAPEMTRHSVCSPLHHCRPSTSATHQTSSFRMGRSRRPLLTVRWRAPVPGAAQPAAMEPQHLRSTS
jgi:hypothetical protein